MSKKPSEAPYAALIAENRCRPASTVGEMIYRMGLSTRPLSACEVYRIEERAMAKIKTALEHQNEA